MKQQEWFEKLGQKQEDILYEWIDYWKEYSYIDTWQFWANVFMLIVPLVILYFTLDRRRAFHIGFYGFGVHVYFAYTDAVFDKLGYAGYPYQIHPLLTISFSLDASLVPVAFMLMYQWVINNEKNYYLAMFALSATLSFVLKPILVATGIFDLGKSTYFHLLGGYISVGLIAKWTTDIFLKAENSVKR